MYNQSVSTVDLPHYVVNFTLSFTLSSVLVVVVVIDRPFDVGKWSQCSSSQCRVPYQIVFNTKQTTVKRCLGSMHGAISKSMSFIHYFIPFIRFFWLKHHDHVECLGQFYGCCKGWRRFLCCGYYTRFIQKLKESLLTTDSRC